MSALGLLDTKLRRVYRRFAPVSPLRTADRIDDVLYLDDHDIMLAKLGFQWGDLGDSRTLLLLCRLVASGYAPVFEFGTFRGRTTYNMALNLSRDSDEVVSLDGGAVDDSEANIESRAYPAHTPGELILSAPTTIRKRVKLISANSTQFDFSPYQRQFRLVFVDGGHSYEVCMSDSRHAFELLQPGGIVVWDDYNDFWPGVKKALDELSKTRPITLVRSENLVVCCT